MYVNNLVGQSGSLLTHTFSSAASLFLFFLMFMEDLDFFMYDNLYNMCMLSCDILAVYFYLFIQYIFVCLSVNLLNLPLFVVIKALQGLCCVMLMLCIRHKMNFLYRYLATLRQILETSIGTSTVRKKTIKVFRPLNEEEELVSQLQKLNRLRNLMVNLRMCSTKVIIVRSHFSVGRPRFHG